MTVDAAHCWPYAEVQQHLTEQYGETPGHIGLASDGRLLLVERNAETGTWTILLVDAQGTACGVASGKDWEESAKPLPGRPT